MLRRHHDHAVESLRATLKSLRTRSGLTVERLRATELTLASFLDLDVVRQLEQTQQLPPEEAIVAVVRGAAAQLDVDDMLIVDAALALGLVAESFPDGPGLGDLYAPDLSDRRTALVAQWASLHELVGAARATPPPTVRSLRAELESRAFERLAERILTASPLDAVSSPVGATSAGDRARPRVLVIGAAVMDHIHTVDHVPEAGTSIQARSYQSQPGGKGLNQAVAAARLGMDAQLLAMVGNDAAGRKILEFLESEGVDTDLVQLVPGGTTPVATVMVTPDGTASTIGWMNQEQIGVTVRDVRSRSVTAALQESDAVLLTFEMSRDTIEATLEAAAGVTQSPTTLLTPSPPYEGPRFAHESLRYVDYVIGTEWELGRLLPSVDTDPPLDQLLTQLLVLGAGTVCVAEAFGCVVRSNALSLEVPRFSSVSFKEASGARDAFAAALALRLHESGGQLDEADARWATAAMAASQTFGGVASSMPSPDEVDRNLKLASSAGDNGVR